MVRYAALVADALRSNGPDHSEFNVRTVNVALPFSRPRWCSAGLFTWLNHLWLFLTAARRLRRSDADLVHILDGSYAYIAPRSKRAPLVATVHDLIPMLQKQGRFDAKGNTWPASYVVKQAIMGLRRCLRLIAVSDNTAKDLVRFAGAASGRVTVVPAALAPAFLSAANAQRDGELEYKGPYVLHVGNNSFYKNRTGVLRIFAQIKVPVGLLLIMVGPPPDNALHSLVGKLSLQGRVRFVESADDVRLAELYAGASLFLFPSFYEGFGWPPLEAMACGCPVVCSTEGSLPGVLGDAALMAPARKEKELAALCGSVLSDSALAHRLSTAGRKHASSFTLERMGRQLAEVYEAALSYWTPTHQPELER
jgi:glycosyltransferase involved in cell wall biosynthesis